jgi:hypothetical protein
VFGRLAEQKEIQIGEAQLIPDHVSSHTVSSIEARGRSLMRKIALNLRCDGDQSTHRQRADSDGVKQSRAAGLLDRNLNLNLDRVTF